MGSFSVLGMSKFYPNTFNCKLYLVLMCTLLSAPFVQIDVVPIIIKWVGVQGLTCATFFFSPILPPHLILFFFFFLHSFSPSSSPSFYFQKNDFYNGCNGIPTMTTNYNSKSSSLFILYHER